MSLPNPVDPSLPANPSPLFSDTAAARGDHLRANNAEIWANFSSLQSSKVEGNLSIDGTFASVVDALVPSVKAIKTFIDSMFPIGIMIEHVGITLPGTFWMAANGDSILRASYPTLWGNLSAVIGTCTISNATPALVTKTGHGLKSGQCIAFTSNGSLPAPLGVETKYYVTVMTVDTFKLSTTYTNCLAGTFVNTTNPGSGTHTLRYNPWGVADATHFNLPDTRGLVTVGSGQQGLADWAGVNYLEDLGQYKQDMFESHFHNTLQAGNTGGSTTRIPPSDGTFVTPAPNAVAPITDGVNPLRTGSITSPARVGVNKLVRVL